MSIIIPASAPFPLQWSAIFQILPLFISLYNIWFLVLRNDVFGPRYRIIRYVIRSAVLPVSSLTPFLSLSATSPLRRFISTNAFLISPLRDFSFPLFSPFLCSLLARAPFRGSVPSLLPLPRPPVFQPFYPEPRWERCIYIYISQTRDLQLDSRRLRGGWGTWCRSTINQKWWM